MGSRGSRQAARLLGPLHGNDGSAASKEPSEKDAARVTRAQAGDETVWDEWFHEYYRPLFRYAYLRLRSSVDAEDTVAKVFVEAYRGINGYKHTGKPLLAWLYRIAHNVVYDHLKAESRRIDKGDDVQDIELALGDGPETKIISIDLLNAIDELTPEQREVIILRYFMAMPSLEVGALLGKTQPAVFSLQSRALASLRSKLGEVLEL